MRITEFAARVGVKVSTIRFYERAGLLVEPQRRSNGYRDYGSAELRHVRFLIRGRELGFSLTELAAFAALTGGVVSPAEVTEQATAKVAEIDDRIAALRRTRAALVQIAERPTFDAHAECPVIEALGGEQYYEAVSGSSSSASSMSRNSPA